MNVKINNYKNFIHPDLREGEIFFTNSDILGFKSMPWKTKRKGKAPYDGKGNLINVNDWFPVFLQLEELEKTKNDLITIRREFRDKVIGFKIR